MPGKNDCTSGNRYEINLTPNEFGGFYARFPDFPSIFTGGQTAEEAMKNAKEALDLMIDEYNDRKIPLPEPKTEYSGHFNVRLPKELHRDLTMRAKDEGVSLNALITFLLAKISFPEADEAKAGSQKK